VSAEPKYLYLTTTGRRSGLPRQIEIWFTRHQARYYLVAEHGLRAQWVQNLLAEPAVQARVGRRSVRARARVVDGRAEGDLVATVRRLSEAKYGWGAGLVIEISPTATRATRRSPRRGSGRRRPSVGRPRR
jgi:deazaflavin-dependent oxidoreductase (nitroreductase family)